MTWRWDTREAACLFLCSLSPGYSWRAPGEGMFVVCLLVSYEASGVFRSLVLAGHPVYVSPLANFARDCVTIAGRAECFGRARAHPGPLFAAPLYEATSHLALTHEGHHTVKNQELSNTPQLTVHFVGCYYKTDENEGVRKGVRSDNYSCTPVWKRCRDRALWLGVTRSILMRSIATRSTLMRSTFTRSICHEIDSICYVEKTNMKDMHVPNLKSCLIFYGM